MRPDIPSNGRQCTTRGPGAASPSAPAVRCHESGRNAGRRPPDRGPAVRATKLRRRRVSRRRRELLPQVGNEPRAGRRKCYTRTPSPLQSSSGHNRGLVSHLTLERIPRRRGQGSRGYRRWRTVGKLMTARGGWVLGRPLLSLWRVFGPFVLLTAATIALVCATGWTVVAGVLTA